MKWKRLATWLFLLLAWAGLAVWQWSEYSHLRRLAFDELHRQAETVNRALVGGIRTHRRTGRFFAENLRGALNELVKSEIVLAVAVESDDGKRLAFAGKEIVAQLIHQWSPRAKQPMIVANCAGLPESLVESELFGHVKGTFTGASEDRKGVFRAADGGTLFLDEIGELPLHLQPKLLRALEAGQITPVRELRNAIQRACLVCRGDVIMPEHLPPNIASRASGSERRDADAGRLSQVERATILATLEECDGNRTHAAKKLGISRRALIYKLRAIEAEAQ